MYTFSEAEFNIMIEELIGGDHITYDMLYYIAEKTLRPTVQDWCYKDPALYGKADEDDIMQDIHFRLAKTCITKFLRRDGCDGPINNDPEGFRSWMFKVALNIKKDYSNRKRRHYFNERNLDDSEQELTTDSPEDTLIISQERVLLLKRAFAIVIESDAQVYKVLTWIAQFLFILQYDVTKIESNELIIKKFENKTLFEMRDMLLGVSGKLVWLEVTDKQREKIERALLKKWDDKRVTGQVKFFEFFMQKGAKATISDWVNRMNNMIKRVTGNETFNG